jgi:hypothetical protein
MNKDKYLSLESKVSGLENNPEKAIIRQDINSQTRQFVENFNVKILSCITLPAKEYFFEKALEANFKNFPTSNKCSVHFNCAEKSPKIMKLGLLVRPECCTISLLPIEDLISKPIALDKNRIGRVDNNAKRITDYNFLWADYCQRPHRKVINSVVEKIATKKNHDGHYYFTFSLTRDGERNLIKNMKAPFSYGIQKAVNNYVLNQFHKKCDKKARLIYSVLYKGGRNSKMITLGIIIGKVHIDTIFANRYELNKKNNSRNRQLFERTKARSKKWFVKTRKERSKKSYKPHSKKSNLNQKDRNLIALTYRIDNAKGIDRKIIAKKIVNKKSFANRKISVQQVSAVISWLASPKLKAKAKN